MRIIPLVTALLASPALAQVGSQTPAVNPYSVQQPAFTCGAGDQSLAINGLLANGGTVTIAAGTCLLSNGLHISVSGTTLNGAGIGKTIFVATQPNTINMIEVGSARATSKVSGVTVSNLSLNGVSTVKGSDRSKTGDGVLVHGGVSQSNFINIESYNQGGGGINLAGSYDTITGGSYHDNRHGGIYVAGNARLAQPWADHDTVNGSSVANNSMDGLPGNKTGQQTWDGIDFDTLQSNGLIENTHVVGNDILLSDHRTPGGSGPDLVRNNVVTNSNQAGIRVYGLIHDFTLTGNTLTNPGYSSGIIVVGGSFSGDIDHNTLTGQSAYGVDIFPLAGQPTAHDIIVSTNSVKMNAGPGKPAFSVIAATGVTLEYNNGNGAPYATAQAGNGLVLTGNH